MPKAKNSPLVAQHNALVNARFKMSTMEMRLFLALISRIGRDDDELGEHLIPVRELGAGGNSNAVHEEVEQMLRGILSRFVLVAELGPNGEPMDRPNLIGRPLMGKVDYLTGQGLVRASFNVHMKPYLLDLRQNFTRANLSNLLKLKSPASHRIYWLLAQNVGLKKTTRSVGLDELRGLLGLTTEYADRFDHFRTRVLERARRELDQTDMAFTYTTKTQARAVNEIIFVFGTGQALSEQEPAEPPRALNTLSIALPPANQRRFEPASWQELLLKVGVSLASLEKVQAGLTTGSFEEGYIRFVVTRVMKDASDGRVKRPAGAIFKGILDGFYQEDYQNSLKVNKAASRRVGVTARRKLEDALDDAQRTLQWLRYEAPADTYPPEKRALAVAEFEQKVAGLRKGLEQAS